MKRNRIWHFRHLYWDVYSISESTNFKMKMLVIWNIRNAFFSMLWCLMDNMFDLGNYVAGVDPFLHVTSMIYNVFQTCSTENKNIHLYTPVLCCVYKYTFSLQNIFVCYNFVCSVILRYSILLRRFLKGLLEARAWS